MGQSKQLFELQEIQQSIKIKIEELQKVTDLLDESEALIRARSEHAELRERMDDLNRQQHAIEWDIDDVRTKIAPAEEKLYSGNVTNPKELANLQHEVELHKAKQTKHEDTALELMEQIENNNKNLTASESHLILIEKQWKQEQKQFLKEQTKLKRELTSLEQKELSMIGHINPSILDIYKEVCDNRQGNAVARVANGMCMGCRINLSLAELQRARVDEQLIMCSYCGRIIYLPS